MLKEEVVPGKKRAIDICTRIEGHMFLDFVMKMGKLSAINVNMEGSRGYERLLVGKRFEDVPRIVSRLCGLCHSSHAIAAIDALSLMSDPRSLAPVPAASRGLMRWSEFSTSHGMHVLFQGYPDLLALSNPGGKTPSLGEMIHECPEFTGGMFNLVQAGRMMGELAGARAIHHLLLFRNLLEKERQHATKILDEAIATSHDVLFQLEDPYSKLSPDQLSDYSLQDVAWLTSTGRQVQVTLPNGLVHESPVEEYNDVIHIEEGLRLPSTFLDDGMYFVTGPLARYHQHGGNNLVKLPSGNELAPDISNLIQFIGGKWERNALLQHFLEVAEIHVMAIEARAALGEENVDRDIEPTPHQATGYSAVEAPRGVLFHEYKSDNGETVSDAKILVPTLANLEIMEIMASRYGISKHRKGHLLDRIREETTRVIRCFDPCVSCATRVIGMPSII